MGPSLGRHISGGEGVLLTTSVDRPRGRGMASREVPVQQAREALRLWSRGEGLRGIAASQGAGRLAPQIHNSLSVAVRAAGLHAT
jgi:hypothetical protein